VTSSLALSGTLSEISQVLQRLPQFPAGELVQCAERLVQQQQVWIMDGRSARISALQHSAGLLPGKVTGEVL